MIHYCLRIKVVYGKLIKDFFSLHIRMNRANPESVGPGRMQDLFGEEDDDWMWTSAMETPAANGANSQAESHKTNTSIYGHEDEADQGGEGNSRVLESQNVFLDGSEEDSLLLECAQRMDFDALEFTPPFHSTQHLPLPAAPSEPKRKMQMPVESEKEKPKRGKSLVGIQEALSSTYKQDERTSSTVPLSAWADLFREHACLLERKGQIPGRTFNKTALQLLDRCVTLAKTSPLLLPSLPPQTGPSLAGHNNVISGNPQSNLNCLWDTEKEALNEFRALLLSNKEQMSESLVCRVVEFVEKSLSPKLSADEKKHELQKKTLAFVSDISPAISVKIAPIIKSHIARKFESQMEDLFAEIHLPEMSLKEKAEMYSRMLSRFIDDPDCVSFATANRQLLGKLEPKDMWFLTFYAFVTARRSRGDSLLMLGVVGEFNFF